MYHWHHAGGEPIGYWHLSPDRYQAAIAIATIDQERWRYYLYQGGRLTPTIDCGAPLPKISLAEAKDFVEAQAMLLALSDKDVQ